MNPNIDNKESVEEKWLSMSEAAVNAPYSAEYLSLLARKGKLTAKKINNTWYTTRSILDDYMKKQMIRAQVQNGNFSGAPTPSRIQDDSIKQLRSLRGDTREYLKEYEDFLVQNKIQKSTGISPLKRPTPASTFLGFIPNMMLSQIILPLKKLFHRNVQKQSEPQSSPIAQTTPASSPEQLFEPITSEIESALERVIDRKFNRGNQNLNQNKSGRISSSARTVFSSKTLIAATILCILVLTIFPIPLVFSFFEKSVDFVKNSIVDSNTVMGFRPGTHANEILLLSKDGNISIMGHIETEGQFRSYAPDGTAPIVVDSKTMVKNLNAEYLGGASSTDFTLAFITKNGAVTTDDVTLGGSVDVGKTLKVGQTLVVNGATKLLSSLEVDGNTRVLGDAEFSQMLKVLGPAYFKGLVTMQDNLSVNKNLSVRGSITSGSSIIAKKGSLGSLGVSGKTSLDTFTADDGVIENATSTNFFASTFNTVLATITSLIADDITVNGLTATNSTTTNATTTNFSAIRGSFATLCLDADTCRTTWPGGGSSNSWATTTSEVFGQFINYSLNNTDIVAIGGTSTSSAVFSFDPNIALAKLGGQVLITGSTTLQNFTFVNATGSAATTTNLYTSGQTILAGASGNVGIGTTNPQGILDVAGIPNNGSVYLRSVGRPFLDIKGGTDSYKTLRFSEGADGTYLWDVNIEPTNNNMEFWSGGGSRIAFTSSGRLGVGTSDPGYGLEVSGNSGTSPMIVARNAVNSTDTNWGSLGILNDASYAVGNNARLMFLAHDASQAIHPYATLGLEVEGEYMGALTFNTRNSGGTGERMRIMNTGNVGIGTTNPNFKLEVNGTASTTNFFASYATTTNSTSTSLFSTTGTFTNLFGTTNTLTNLLVTSSTTLQDFTALNSTTTNSTSTSFFSTTGTFTNLFGATSTLTNLLVTGSTTLQNFTFVNATGTNATTTSFFSTNGVFSNLFATNATTTYATSTNFFSTTGTFTNLFGTTANFTNLLTTNATSTYATSTNLYTSGQTTLAGVSGNVGIGTINPGTKLDVVGNARISSTFTISNTTGCTGGQALQTNISGDVACGTISVAGISSAGGWTTNNIGQVFLSTTTDQVVTGASSSPYAKFTIISSNTASTTLVLVPASAQTANVLDIYNSSGALSSVLTASGKLGIGTTNPLAKLHVNSFDGTYDQISAIFHAGENWTSGFNRLQMRSGNGDGIVKTEFVTAIGSAGAGADLRFRVADASDVLQDRMTILAGGNVGIGTINPNFRLEINGTASTTNLFVTNATTTNLFSTTASSTNLFSTYSNLGVVTSGLINGQTISDAANFTGSLTVAGSTTIQNFTSVNSTTTNATSTTLYVSGTTTLAALSGSVGIGTVNPLAKLDVNSYNGTYDQISAIFQAGEDWTNAFNRLQMRSGNGDGIVKTEFVTAIGSAGAGADLRFRVADASDVLQDRMTILAGGNVGIGTTAPLAKLSLGNNLANTKLAIYDDGTYLMGLGIQSNDFRLHLAHNAQSFNFYDAPAGNSLMTIKGDGNVGIGTTTPSSLLELRAVGNNSVITLNRQGAWASITSGLKLTTNDVGTSYWTFGLQPDSTDNLYLKRNSTTYMTVLDATGNVGIGTTGPESRLDVRGSYSVFDGDQPTSIFNIVSTDAAAVNTGGTLQFGGNTGNANAVYGFAAMKGAKESAVAGNYAGYLSFYTVPSGSGMSERMRINSVGNVGVGTTNPIALLHTSYASSGLVPVLYANNAWPQFPKTLQNVSASITTNDTTVDTGPVIGLNLENSSQINNTYSPLITFSRKSASGDYNPTYASIGGVATGNGANTDWLAGDLTFGTANSTGPVERMRILSSGNVGIGTSAPNAKLDVFGTAVGQTSALISARGRANSFEWGHFNATGYLATLGYLSSAGNPYLAFNGEAGTIADTFKTRGIKSSIIMSDLSGGMQFGNVGTAAATDNQVFVPLITLLNTGNVGIGITNPNYKLEVNGTASTTNLLATNLTTISATSTTLYVSGTTTLAATSGRVGIGTTNPGAKLDVNSFNGTYDQISAIFHAGENWTGGFNRIQMRSGTGDGVVKTEFTDVIGVAGAGADLRIRVADASDVLQDRLTIQAGGNVGIGTTNPQYKLDVNGTIGGNGNVTIVQASGDLTTRFSGAYGSSGKFYISNASEGDGGFKYNAGNTMDVFSYGDLRFNVGTANISGAIGNERMVIKQSGNVGIGTTNPSEKLDVNGALRVSSDRQGNSQSPAGFIDYNNTNGYMRFLSHGLDATTRGAMSFSIRETDYGNELMPLELKANGNVILAQTTGNVGIGTTNPQGKLHITGGAITSDVTSDTSELNTWAGINANYQFATAYWGIRESTAHSFNIDVYNSNNEIDALTILQNGNVGVGTANPGSNKLMITGGDSTNSTIKVNAPIYPMIDFYSDNVNGNNRNWRIASVYNSYGTFEILSSTAQGGVPSTSRLSIDLNGNVGIGITNPGAALDIYSNTAYRTLQINGVNGAIGDTSSKIALGIIEGGVTPSDVELRAVRSAYVNPHATDFAIAVAGTERLRIDKTGNVGIGTTNPSAKLSIVSSGSETVGTSQSNAFRLSAGAIGNIAGDEISLGSFSFVGGATNNMGLGIRGVRLINGTAYTNTAVVLGFDVDNSVREGGNISLRQGGNVGIGIVNPTQLLTVGNSAGSAGSNFYSIGTDKMAVSGSFYSYGYICAGNNNGDCTGANGVVIGPANTSAGININSAGSGNSFFNNGGNLGIGITNPPERLSIVNSGSYASVVVGNGTNGSYFGYANAAGNYNADATSGDAIVRGTTGVSIAGNNGAAGGLYVSSSNNIGIGTTNPGNALHIYKNQNQIANFESPNPNTWIDITSTSHQWSLGSTVEGSGFAIYERSGANQTRLNINAGGNVGIGTTGPATKLHIKGSSANGAPVVTTEITSSNNTFDWSSTEFASNMTAGNNLIHLIGQGGSTKNSGYIGFNYQGAGSNSNFLTFGMFAVDNIMNITGAGNVGIGTTAPGYPLTVSGTVKSYSTGISSFTLGKDATTGTDYGKLTYDDSNGDLILSNPRAYAVKFATDDTVRMTIVPTTGNVGIGTTNPNAKLVVGDGTGTQRLAIDGAVASQIDLAFRKAGTVKWLEYMDANSNDLRFNDGADRLTLQSGGNVGIGVTSPTGQLSLKNQIFTSDALKTYAGASGVEGQSILNSYYTVSALGASGPYPRILDIASVGSPDGTNGGGVIRFLTNPITLNAPAVERMRINDNGNVGIGMTAPGDLYADFNKLVVGDGSGAEGTTIYSSTYGSLAFADATSGSGEYAGLISYNHAVDKLSISAGGNGYSSGLTLDSSNNVGIGTTNPQVNLHVYGANGLIRAEGTGGQGGVQIVSSGTNNPFINFGTGGTVGNIGSIYGVGATTDLRFFVNGADRMTILSGGNVGIGTTNPLQKLQVAGHCVTGDTLIPIRRRRKKKCGRKENGDESLAGEAEGNVGSETWDYLMVPIRDIQPGDEVLSLNKNNGLVEYHAIKGLMDMGVQDVYELKTKSGRIIRTTSTHPYLVKIVKEKSKGKWDWLSKIISTLVAGHYITNSLPNPKISQTRDILTPYRRDMVLDFKDNLLIKT